MIFLSFHFFRRFDDLWLDMATSNNNENMKKNENNNDSDNETSSG